MAPSFNLNILALPAGIISSGSGRPPAVSDMSTDSGAVDGKHGSFSHFYARELRKGMEERDVVATSKGSEVSCDVSASPRPQSSAPSPESTAGAADLGPSGKTGRSTPPGGTRASDDGGVALSDTLLGRKADSSAEGPMDSRGSDGSTEDSKLGSRKVPDCFGKGFLQGGGNGLAAGHTEKQSASALKPEEGSLLGKPTKGVHPGALKGMIGPGVKEGGFAAESAPAGTPISKTATTGVVNKRPYNGPVFEIHTHLGAGVESRGDGRIHAARMGGRFPDFIEKHRGGGSETSPAPGRKSPTGLFFSRLLGNVPGEAGEGGTGVNDSPKLSGINSTTVEDASNHGSRRFEISTGAIGKAEGGRAENSLLASMSLNGERAARWKEGLKLPHDAARTVFVGGDEEGVRPSTSRRGNGVIERGQFSFPVEEGGRARSGGTASDLMKQGLFVKGMQTRTDRGEGVPSTQAQRGGEEKEVPNPLLSKEAFSSKGRSRPQAGENFRESTVGSSSREGLQGSRGTEAFSFDATGRDGSLFRGESPMIRLRDTALEGLNPSSRTEPRRDSTRARGEEAKVGTGSFSQAKAGVQGLQPFRDSVPEGRSEERSLESNLKNIDEASMVRDRLGRRIPERSRLDRDERVVSHTSSTDRLHQGANIQDSGRSAPPTRFPLDIRPFSEQLSSVASSLGTGGFQRVRIQLTPPNLGSLDMEVIVKDKAVKVLFRVESTDACRFLQAGTEQLKASLKAQGFTVESFSVSQRDHDHQQWAAFQQGSGQDGETGRGEREEETFSDRGLSYVASGVESDPADPGRINYFV